MEAASKNLENFVRECPTQQAEAAHLERNYHARGGVKIAAAKCGLTASAGVSFFGGIGQLKLRVCGA
jgi:hypothetical protein